MPFSLNFRSDQYEVSPGEAVTAGNQGNVGFNLIYFMDAIGCDAAPTLPRLHRVVAPTGVLVLFQLVDRVGI